MAATGTATQSRKADNNDFVPQAARESMGSNYDIEKLIEERLMTSNSRFTRACAFDKQDGQLVANTKPGFSTTDAELAQSLIDIVLANKLEVERSGQSASSKGSFSIDGTKFTVEDADLDQSYATATGEGAIILLLSATYLIVAQAKPNVSKDIALTDTQTFGRGLVDLSQ
ncbi:uncharacterized protein L969DRAFT_85542 [Mixia osmundae IAM 14324]|uniref:Profilin n=1 Tax=Mixia osmundae (strain CBS 9802 / IAM 14324 / JCM 22182 / KY 12970) TaxID=764103 RepID=G7DTV7_MIXOS|nr:uncharacterized protein L969DRAFT_85542 [Mixia osmundae IAM 14324]KEI41731.1 hypothetical protein L969DRAFT_85542 [Mixia osmundae IAM 14324]GAA94017.1 hypothetical protein E5Q_00664 [Mixia osmundae IAM 14324]